MNLADLFGRFSSDSSSEFILGNAALSPPGGSDVSKLEGGNLGDLSFHEAINMIARGGGARLAARRLYWLRQPRGFQKACQTFRQYVRDFVIKRPSDTAMHGPSVLDGLVSGHHANDVDEVELCNELIGLFMAAYETSKSLPSFALVMLARHPEMFQHLGSEVIARFGNGREGMEVPTAEEVLALPYVSAASCEQSLLFQHIS